MDNNEFMQRCQQRRAAAETSSAETRARIELYNIKLCELRDTHACLMRHSSVDIAAICRRAVFLDARDGCARRHTNNLGVTFYKYLK